jgi:predicted RNA-binding Zn-ribbon protein involved in translation (DUF1610 family)
MGKIEEIESNKLDYFPCVKCGSENIEKWAEGDPHGVTHKSKCKDCGWIWITAQFY